MAAIRSDSLTRNSAAPVIRVRPCAQAAATNNAGNSSMASGTSAGGMSTPRKADARIRRSATGSAPAARTLVSSTWAPIISRIFSTPAREGLTPTFGRLISDCGVIAAATRGKVAEERSAGTSIRVAVSRCPPRTEQRRPCTGTSTPKLASMRSVWSLLMPGSSTRVVPSAYKPASSSALLT